MTEENDLDLDMEEMDQEAYLDDLKAQADLLGVSYHPNIGVEKLQGKIDDHKQAMADAEEQKKAIAEKAAKKAVAELAEENPGAAKIKETRAIRAKAQELVRVEITCMNPNKNAWKGEFVTCSNSVVPTMTRFVPYSVETHIPRMMLNILEGRQCQIFITDENKNQKGKTIKEFAIRYLPALTDKELKALAQRQAMAAGTSEV